MKAMTISQRSPGWYLGWLAALGSGLMILFWVLYFSRVIVFPESEGVITGYESAFVIADLMLTVLLMTAGVGLLNGKPWGLFCMVMAASMAVYLGLLDFNFYLNQGLYATVSVAGVIELAVNLICVAGGAGALAAGWKEWRGR